MKFHDRLNKVAARTEQDLQPEQLMPALSQGLKAVLGSMKLLRSTSGKLNTKVYACATGKGKDVYKLLNILDFVTIRMESSQTYCGTRLEVNGKKTYVTYAAHGGVLVISSNASDIDV